MSTVTTRLGLIKPAGTEQVDVALLNANADQIDYTSGVILVNAGVVPPNSSLFDGAVVMEKTTGVMWVAVKNGSGGFDRYYQPTSPNVTMLQALIVVVIRVVFWYYGTSTLGLLYW